MGKEVIGWIVLGVILLFGASVALADVVQNITVKHAASSLEDGLVSHITLDGKDLIYKAEDVSGNGNSGTLDGFTSTTTVPGAIGQALSFNGTSDNIVVSNDVLTPSGTLCMWIRFNGSQIGGQTVLQENAAGYLDWDMLDSDTLEVSLFDTGFKNLNVDIENNVWHHICATYNTSTVKAYRDGSEITSTAFTGLNANATGYTYGSNRNDSELLSFHGDEVRIYNRVLSANEIKALYKLGATTHINTTIKHPASSLEDGLLAHWTFDGKDTIEIIEDISGSDLDGKLVGFSATNTIVGRIGQALDFDGAGDYVEIVGDGDLIITGDISVAAWVRADTFANTFAAIANKGLGGADTPNNRNTIWGLFLTSSSGIKPLWFHEGNNGINVLLTGSTPVSLNEWVHIIGVRDVANNEVTFYVNGVGETPISYTDEAIGGEITDTRIGDSYVASQAFDGTIDDVRVYNRQLSASEAKALYNLGATTHLNTTVQHESSSLEDGLVGHWTFDGKDFIDNAVDVSGTGNTGVLEDVSTTTVPGVVGQGIVLDGTGYVDLGTDASINPQSLTITAWVKVSSLPNSYNTVVHRGNASTYYEYYIKSDGTLAVYLRGAGGAVFYDGTGTYSVPLDKWTHVAFTYNSTDGLVGYIDGKEDATAAADGTLSSIVWQTNIGRDSFTSGRSLDAAVDDVRIYNRALSAEEMAYLYRLGR